jgi:hypothetical protein
VYPRLIMAGKLEKQVAAHREDCIEEALRLLKERPEWRQRYGQEAA